MSSEFLTPCLLERKRNSWIMFGSLDYRSDMLGKVIRVPVGFVTDFASIPTFFHRLLPKNGEYDMAAVIHDWLYYNGEVPKSVADLVFYEAMIVLEVAPWKRNTMYCGVKYFAFAAWAKHRKDQLLRDAAGLVQ